jgi:selenophosphate synthase
VWHVMRSTSTWSMALRMSRLVITVVVHVKMKKEAELNANESLQITRFAGFVIYIAVTLLGEGVV